MIATFQLKKHMANICVFGIIISKLGHRQKLCPIILLKINEGSEVGFYDTVLLFGLAISLQIEGGEKPMLNTKKIAKQ